MQPALRAVSKAAKKGRVRPRGSSAERTSQDRMASLPPWASSLSWWSPARRQLSAEAAFVSENMPEPIRRARFTVRSTPSEAPAAAAAARVGGMSTQRDEAARLFVDDELQGAAFAVAYEAEAAAAAGMWQQREAASHSSAATAAPASSQADAASWGAAMPSTTANVWEDWGSGRGGSGQPIDSSGAAAAATAAAAAEPATAATAAAAGVPELETVAAAAAESAAAAAAAEAATVEPDLRKLQLQWEAECQRQALESYREVLDGLHKIGKGSGLRAVQRQLLRWHQPLRDAILEEQAAVWRQERAPDRPLYGPLLVLLQADKLALLTLHELVGLCLKAGNDGIPTVTACLAVADAVQAEVNLCRMDNKLGSGVVSSLQRSGRSQVRTVNSRVKRALDMLEVTDWPKSLKVKLGAVLIKFLMETATHEASGQSAFLHKKIMMTQNHRQRGGKQHMQGHIQMTEPVHRLLSSNSAGAARFASVRHLPMLVEPLPWKAANRGAYLRLRTHVLRVRNGSLQVDALKDANLREIFEGLNCLSQTRWRINTDVFDVAKEAWRLKLEVAEIPSQRDMPLPIPPRPGSPEEAAMAEEARELARASAKLLAASEKKQRPLSKEALAAGKIQQPSAAAKAAHTAAAAEVEDVSVLAKRMHASAVRKAKRHNRNLHSLRCDHKIKVDIAERLRDHAFYFPYNMDFRGRAYPVPPNLNHMGNDFCRGMLIFDEARPLGERGLYWLKVHLANLYGKDKLPFDERVKFAEAHLDEARDSAERPLEGHGWWSAAEKPWECLAVCIELTRALAAPDPTKYMSRLPVHQDGSCNGLQHYAALGRDALGGMQVNLLPSDRPQDVYQGVCSLVAEKVNAEADRELPPDAPERQVQLHRMATLVRGLVDRKLVKQTVMTSVYGVTFVGARLQIQSRLREKLSSGGRVLNEQMGRDIYLASYFLAMLTMSCMGELFSEARAIMDWLATLAKLVAKEGQPMAWMTPLGLPVMQPYRRNGTFQVRTLLQSVHLQDDGDHCPVAPQRQRSAFPPNFVHSLDSTHMLLTAVAMHRKGMPFAAVHDSYWTHAGGIDEMNETLRECFLELYSRPILEELHASLCLRYPGVDFPPVPDRGTLQLEKVAESPYFFS